MTEIRKYIQEVCRELMDSYSDKGFVILKSGLKTKRKVDKDITQEIWCQITSYHDIIIHFNVQSKKTEKWLKETYQMQYAGGLGTQLGYITPQNTWKSWTIGKSEIAKVQFLKEAKGMIDDYLMPYLDSFYDMPTLIESICQQGSITKVSIPPVSFVLQYGSIKQVGRLLENFFENNPKIFTNALKNKKYFEDASLNTSPFMGAQEIKIAILNNVILKAPFDSLIH